MTGKAPWISISPADCDVPLHGLPVSVTPETVQLHRGIARLKESQGVRNQRGQTMTGHCRMNPLCKKSLFQSRIQFRIQSWSFRTAEPRSGSRMNSSPPEPDEDTPLKDWTNPSPHLLSHPHLSLPHSSLPHPSLPHPSLHRSSIPCFTSLPEQSSPRKHKKMPVPPITGARASYGPDLDRD